MTLTLSPELEAAVKAAAEKQQVDPEALAISALRQQFLPREWPLVPRDDWERRILAMGTACGVVLSDEDLSSEGLYD